MAYGNQDPFETVKAELVSSLRQLDTYHKRWRDVVTAGDAGAVEGAKQNVLLCLTNLTDDVTDLEEAIQAATQNRAKFGLTAGEVEERRQFARDTKAKIQQITNEVQASPRRGGEPAAQVAKAKGKDKEEKFNEEVERDNTRFIQQHLAYHDNIQAEQDKNLEVVAEGIRVIRGHADDIKEELKVQDGLLDTLQDRVSVLSERIQQANRRVNQLLSEMNDGKKICCIIALVGILVAIVVLFFVL